MRKLLFSLAVLGACAIAAPALAADGTISGTVTRAADGTAISGIWLSAQNISTKAYTYVYGTGADGSYSLTLAPGTYDLATYTSVTAEPNVFYLRKTSTLTLASGEIKSGQNFALTRGGQFSGHVYAADGVTPVNGVTLSFVNASGSTFGFGYATTVSDGSYVSSPTPADTTQSAVGTYTLTISKSGYYSAQITGLALTGDETTVTQNVSLTPASTVTGTIVDQNGAAVSGATVTITKTGSSVFYGTYTAVTNAAGVYTVSVFDTSSYNGTAVSDYTVTVSKSGYISKTSTLSIVADGTALTGNNYTLTLGKTYSGTVVAKSNNAGIANAYVYLYKRNKVRADIPDFTATTNSSGAFSIAGIQTGKYRVKVVKNKYVTIVIDSLNIKADISGATHKLDLGGIITGSIYTGNHVGIDGASIGVYALKNGKQVSYTSTTADESGNYTVSGLKAGTYRLKITTTDYVTQLANVAVKTGTTTTKNLKLTAAGSIEGYVTDSVTGLPVSALIKVVGTSIVTTSDLNGYYALDGVAPGKRKLTAISAYYDMPRQIAVTVRSGRTSTGLNFGLTPKQ